MASRKGRRVGGSSGIKRRAKTRQGGDSRKASIAGFKRIEAEYAPIARALLAGNPDHTEGV